jgi:hypothetical protein
MTFHHSDFPTTPAHARAHSRQVSGGAASLRWGGGLSNRRSNGLGSAGATAVAACVRSLTALRHLDMWFGERRKGAAAGRERG